MPQATYNDPRPWIIHRNRYGWPTWYQRWLEAWWIITGRWSLHAAWQIGKDQGGRDEYTRIMVNGGDLIPVIDAAATATAELFGGNLSHTAQARIRRATFIARKLGEAAHADETGK